MIKFSIIVPVYNVEKYIDKCLKSIQNQTFKNFEVIIVNDGSHDNSQKIINKYVNKDERFKSFIKKNGGLSDARNYGLKHVTGDYILFIDSDDYVNDKLLHNLYKVYEKNGVVDIVKFQLNKVNENGKILEKINGGSYIEEGPDKIFSKVIQEKLFEPFPLYSFNASFWKTNNFKFAKSKFHEDFGLMPLVLIRANKFMSISYQGYNYMIRENSIMTTTSKENINKKINDVLFHFDTLINLIDKEKINENTKKMFKSFLSNSLINKAKELDDETLKQYIKELKRRKVGAFLIEDSFARKIKKIIIKLNLEFYIKNFLKRGN